MPEPTSEIDGEHVIIEGAAGDSSFLRSTDGLDLNVEVRGEDLIVYGPDLNAFLARIDPSTWDPANAIGDA